MQKRNFVIAAIFLISAIAGAAHYLSIPSIIAFILATIALCGLAWIVSFSTERVGENFGPSATSVLQTTLGNLPEFFVVLFALKAGQEVVAQTSIIGSIFANALLVLGVVIVVDALRSKDGVMRFNSRLPNDTATLLMLAVFIIVIIGISVQTGDSASKHVTTISVIGSVALLAVYITWLIPYMRSQQTPDNERGEPHGSFKMALLLLAAAGVGSAFVSDWFIDALTPTMDSLGLSPAFAGLVIVAIAGNAVENTTGVVLAAKGKSDFAVSIVKNSVSQIAVFLFPLLIIVSLFFSTHLTFALAPVYIGALLLTALAMWQITGDGEATLFEGMALIALYVILAALTFYETGTSI